MAGAVEKALDILMWLAEHGDDERSLSEISEGLSLNQSTCACIMSKLKNRRFVVQPKRRGGYRLGSAAYFVGRRRGSRQDLAVAALPLMRKLAKDVDERVSLNTLDHASFLVLARVECEQEVQVSNRAVGDVFQVATGLLLLAHKDEAELQACLTVYNHPEKKGQPASEKVLRRKLAAIRRKGSSVEKKADVVGIGFPVWQGDSVVAALGLAVPTYRFTAARGKRILKTAERTAKAISRELGKAGE